MHNVKSHLLVDSVLLIGGLFKLCDVGVELFKIFNFVFLHTFADFLPVLCNLRVNSQREHLAPSDNFKHFVFVLALLPVFVNHAFAHKWLKLLSGRDEVHRD